MFRFLYACRSHMMLVLHLSTYGIVTSVHIKADGSSPHDMPKCTVIEGCLKSCHEILNNPGWNCLNMVLQMFPQGKSPRVTSGR